MKKVFVITAIFLAIFVFNYPAHSATLTVDVINLDILPPGTGIVSYQTNFNVTGGTIDTVDFSADQPDIFGILGGFNQTGTNLVILADNNFNPTPLLNNGGLYTITYPDTVSLSLTFDSFILSDNTTVVPMNKIPDGAIFGAGANTLTFNPVPIPSTVLLLGAGLMGLVGIRRRVKS
jgi:hypothetical protein